MDTLDIIKELQANEALRSQIRAVILADELLDLPRKFDEFRIATEARFQQVEEQIAENSRQIATLQVAVRELQVAVKELQVAVKELQVAVKELQNTTKELQNTTKELQVSMKQLQAEVAHLSGVVGNLVGRDFERDFIYRAKAYTRKLIKNSRVMTIDEIESLVEEAENLGKITEDEAMSIINLDVLLEGEIGGETAYLAVEVSKTIHDDDFERVRDRKEILIKATGKSAKALVAGVALSASKTEDVYVMVNGLLLESAA